MTVSPCPSKTTSHSSSRCPRFAVLGKQALRILAIGAETRHLANGAVLFYAGELADGGYVVQEGSLLLGAELAARGPAIHRRPRHAGGRVGAAHRHGVPGDRDRQRADGGDPHFAQPVPQDAGGLPGRRAEMRDMVAERVDDWTRELGGVKRTLREDDELDLHRRRHRHVVGGARGAAIILGDLDLGDAAGERVRGPDVIEPAAAVGRRANCPSRDSSTKCRASPAPA